MASSTGSFTRKLDGAPPVLPPISPLIDRRKLQPGYFEPVVESLEKGGFSVGWNDGSLQIGSSLAQSGLSSPASSTRSAFRPRTSGFLSFSRAPDAKSRGHRTPTPGSSSCSTSISVSSAATAAAAAVQPPDAPITPQPTRPQRTPFPRFTRLGASLDSATSNSLLTIAQSHIRDAAADPDQRRQETSLQIQSGAKALEQETAAAPETAASGNSARASDTGAAAPGSGSRTPPLPSQKSPGGVSAPAASGSGNGSTCSNGGGTGGGGNGGGSSIVLPSTAKVASTLGINVPAENLRDSERPGMGMTSRGPIVIIQVPLGQPSARSPQSVGASFKATRGHALMVFNELDSDKNGKVTRSEFEAAAVSLGFSLEQAQRFWDRLDRRRRGYLEALDWGTKDAFPQIQLFSTRYLQKYMGVPDVTSTPEQVRKYVRSQELMQVKSLAAAINMVRSNAVSRAMRAAGTSGNPIFETFRFMDVDGSGVLSKEEIRDAFFALGVFLSEPVVEQIMQTFDKNGNGAVQYHEFESTMFPPTRGA